MLDMKLEARRHFLRYLAGSPLLASLGATQGYADEDGWDELRNRDSPLSELISKPGDAINVFDFERVAEHELPPAHWGYLKTGVVDDQTVRANRDAFKKYYMRPRRLVDVSQVDLSVELFGRKWETPIALSPCGSHNCFHEDGELGVARAARIKRHLMILSTVATNSVGAVSKEYGEPVWFQLYPTPNFELTRGLVAKAEAAGCPALVMTVDQVTGGNRETSRIYRRLDTRECQECHEGGYYANKPNFEGLDLKQFRGHLAPNLTWEVIERLRKITDLKILLKGIVTHEDARLCLEHGVDGIFVSNHGGRASETGWGTLDSLVEVVAVAGGKVPILIDGGFRRGMDVFKAIALGADMVCVGRPYLWGLAAFGQPGVEQVLEILRREFRLGMMTAGTPTVSDIRRSSLGSS